MPKIVVEGPDGKKYAFPDTMPREQINTFMKERYGTKARNETVNDYLARVVREQDATKARAKSVTKEATAAGRAEGERAAERMGVNNAFEMAFAAPAIGMAQQAGARRVFNKEGTILADEAAGLAALNTAGFFIPGMVNERFGERVEEGRRQQPGFAFAGDVAGGMIGGELIGLGLQKAGQAIAPGVSAIGRMFKGKPAAAPAAAADAPTIVQPATPLSAKSPITERRMRQDVLNLEGERASLRAEAQAIEDAVDFGGKYTPEQRARFGEIDTRIEEIDRLTQETYARYSKLGYDPDTALNEDVGLVRFAKKPLDQITPEDVAEYDRVMAGSAPAKSGEVISFAAALRAKNSNRPAVDPITELGFGFKMRGKKPPAQDAEPPLTLGPQNRILPVDRPDALPGDDVEMARALDAWTPSVEQQIRPMGFGRKKPPAERTIEAVGRDIKDIEKQLKRKGYTLNEAETLAEEGTLPAELRGLMIQHGDLVRESGRLQDAGSRAAGGLLRNPQYQRLESELNKASDDIANAEYEIANELRQMGYTWEGDDGEFMGIIDALRREGKLSNYLSSRVADLRAASTRFFDTEDKMKAMASNGLLTERGRDAVEQTFGAAYMSGTGSVAGGQYDLNGDGEIDNTDLAIGSGIGLAAFASPLALRKVAELGGRLKGTKAPAGGDDINAAGFGSPAPRRTEAFMDDRLTPSENKALEMRRNGFSTEEIAEEMDTSTNTVLKFISTAKSKGVEVEPIKRGPPMNRTPDVLRLAEQGLRPNIIAERLGLTRNNVSVLLTKERTRLKKAGKPIPKWMSPRDPGGNIKEVN